MEVGLEIKEATWKTIVVENTTVCYKYKVYIMKFSTYAKKSNTMFKEMSREGCGSVQ